MKIIIIQKIDQQIKYENKSVSLLGEGEGELV